MLTIALAQFRPRKGDYAANLARVTGLLAQAAALDPRPQVVAFPETSLSGYFVEGAVRDLAVPAARLAEDLDAGYRAAVGASAEPIDVVIGFYEVWRATLLALDGAQLVFVVSAAPARGVWPREDDIPGPASTARWERLVRDIAEE